MKALWASTMISQPNIMAKCPGNGFKQNNNGAKENSQARPFPCAPSDSHLADILTDNGQIVMGDVR